MNNKTYSYILITSVFFLFFSCKTAKITNNNINENEVKEVENTKKSTFNTIKENQKIPDFNNLRLKGNLNLEINDPIPNLNLVMYIQKDTKIWTNVNFLIFSARSLITPEKFQAYEKIKKTYVDSDFEYVNSLLGLDFIDFKNSQNLLLGRLFFPFNETDFKEEINPQEIIYISKNPVQIKNKRGSFTYDRIIKFNNDFSLKSIQFIDKSKNEAIFIEYSGKHNFNSIYFPQIIDIKIVGKEAKSISLKYNSVDSEIMETPFNIPENYSKRNF